MADLISIKGARVHNLKNISVDIPKNKLVVITGLSGSGKSSLAFDTLYAEGQRRYVESLSAYARQFLGVMDKPDVDSIEGISPAIAIDQRKGSHNPRSTVGTITEIYDYLRLLFARVGTPHCPKCGKSVSRQSVRQIADHILRLPQSSEIMVLGPVVRGKKGEHRGMLEEIQKGGFVRVRVNGTVHRIEEALNLELHRNKRHSIDVVVDRLVVEKDLDRPRLADSLETALKLGKGAVVVHHRTQNADADAMYSEQFACADCGINIPEIEPRLFSFNSPYGACAGCQGLGQKLEVDPSLVIPNPRLSIAEGGVLPWARASHKIGRQSFFWSQLQTLARKRKFSLTIPIEKLSAKDLHVILHGEQSNEFEGVIPWMERRFWETDSEYAREEIEQYMVERVCEKCKGARLRPEVLGVTVQEKSIHDVVSLQLNHAHEFCKALLEGSSLRQDEKKIAQPILKEIGNRVQFLIDVGLEYLTLARKVGTLSGGEEQRIRLATQIGTKLTGVLYILDEPSIGLHARDQERLIKTLHQLRDLGNTVVVVEHDSQTVLASDWVIDIGPGAGKHGGRVMFAGTPKQLLKSKTLTGEYLSGRKKVTVPRNHSSSSLRVVTKQSHQKNRSFAKAMADTQDDKKEILDDKVNYLTVKGALGHNLKNIDVAFPLGKFVCVTGVSGSGKSTLVNEILAKALLKKFYRAKEDPEEHKEILGTEQLNKVVLVDQSPIGRTPRSNPATYTGAFTVIRDMFTKMRESRIRGYGPGRFSFNVKGGRCESCEGQGVKKIEMFFLPDVYVECEECRGTRYTTEVLEIRYKEKNIADVLNMTVEEAKEFFKNIPALASKLKVLSDVGLGYLELGQPAPALSGGEAQRIKLATELSRRDTGKTLYILDEPTTGLHPDDVRRLVEVLSRLVEGGNTVLVIEHNLDVIRSADWIIDMGPNGGEKGGEIVAEGPPSVIAKSKKSYTGMYLRKP